MKWDIEGIQKWPWNKHPMGSTIPEAGNAENYKTGGWRSQRPIFYAELCTQCRFCWIYCPDSSIVANEEGEVTGIDYDHCKGCGICAVECPKDAIKMEEEGG